MSAASEGIGIALADTALLGRELESGRLVAPFDISLDSHNAFYLVYRKNHGLTPAMMAFRDWILEEMQADIEAANVGN